MPFAFSRCVQRPVARVDAEWRNSRLVEDDDLLSIDAPELVERRDDVLKTDGLQTGMLTVLVD